MAEIPNPGILGRPLVSVDSGSSVPMGMWGVRELAKPIILIAESPTPPTEAIPIVVMTVIT